MVSIFRSWSSRAKALWLVIWICASSYVAHAQAPVITAQPLPLSVAPGDRAGFAVTASGAQPLQYQWYHDGVPVAGANADLVLISGAKAADAGKYIVTVTNSSGSVTSSAAALTVANYTTQSVERVNQPPTAGAPLLRRLLLADGRILFAWQPAALAMDRADGTIDPSFTASLPTTGVVRLADGLLLDGNQVLVWGEAGATESTTVPFIRRLNADGSQDLTFQPPVLTRAPGALCKLGDGYVLLQENRLIRLTRAGAIDPSFVYEPETANGYQLAVRLIRPDTAGRLLVAVGERLLRLKSNGARDSTFAAEVFYGGVSDMQLLPDDAIMVAWRTSRNAPFASIVTGTFHLARCTADGQPDGTFQEFSFSRTGPAGGGGYAAFAVLSDRSVILNGDFDSLPADANRTYARKAGIARLLPDGTVDPAYGVFDSVGSDVYTRGRSLSLSPDGKHVLASVGSSVLRISLEASIAPQPPRILRCVPRSTTWNAGDDVIVDVVVVGGGPLTPSPSDGDYGVVTETNVQPYSGDRFVVVTGPGGTAKSEPFRLNVAPAKPRIVSAPSSVTTGLGYEIAFTVNPRGSAPLEYVWSKDGVLLPNSNSPNFYIPSAAAADAGTYTVRVSNREGSVESSASLQIGPHSELVNLSTRAVAGEGERALMIGFVMAGGGYTETLLRGVGPELANYGVRGVLADPRTTLHFPDGRVALNEDTPIDQPYLPDAIERKLGASPLGIGSKSSLLHSSGPSGVYLLEVTGARGTSGVALGEIYRIKQSSCHLVNLSARAYVGTGDATAISGFVIKGDKPKRLLIRAVGPTLAKYGINDVLANPVLKLVSSVTGDVPATNDEWSSTANVAELQATMAATGAFPLEVGSHDAAMIVTLGEGSYSVLVTGSGGGTGIALMEVYDLD